MESNNNINMDFVDFVMHAKQQTLSDVRNTYTRFHLLTFVNIGIMKNFGNVTQ